MSYERRLEIEALPVDDGWGKWQAIIGHGTELVERKQHAPLTIWIATTNGPKTVEAYRYENWRFAQNGRPADVRWFSYTVWHDNYNYTNYSSKASQLDSLCAETREELCNKATGLLGNDLRILHKSVADKEYINSKFL